MKRRKTKDKKKEKNAIQGVNLKKMKKCELARFGVDWSKCDGRLCCVFNAISPCIFYFVVEM